MASKQLAQAACSTRDRARSANKPKQFICAAPGGNRRRRVECSVPIVAASPPHQELGSTRRLKFRTCPERLHAGKQRSLSLPTAVAGRDAATACTLPICNFCRVHVYARAATRQYIQYYTVLSSALLDVLQPWATQNVSVLTNTHVPWLCSTHSGFPRAHRDHPSAQATRPVAGAIGLPR